MDIKYGIVAVTPQNEIIHFVGYEQKPTQIDFDDVQHELTTDRELGLSDRDDWYIRMAFVGELEFYQELVRDLPIDDAN